MFEDGLVSFSKWISILNNAFRISSLDFDI